MAVSRSSPRHHRPAPRRHKRTIADDLLAWYDVHRRALPWRTAPGVTADPYRVWLSEIMLQQTTVATVGPRYMRFLERWPDVAALAAAPREAVLGEWAGLGYYARARNLHAAAQTVARDHGGRFPERAEDLRRLPGVGAYTAAAIAAIAFGEPVAAMDANAERVIARLFAVQTPLPKARAELGRLAQALVPEQRAGDFAQALMDLGAGICLAQRPRCGTCPVAAHCRARAAGLAERLPRKTAGRARPVKRGAAFVALDRRGAVYLVRRPEKGLLGGMLQPPLGPWAERFPQGAAARASAPFVGEWIKKPGFVRHQFTHFLLEMEVYVARFGRRPAGKSENGQGQWMDPDALARAALPTAMRKVLAHAGADGAEKPAGTRVRT